MRTLLPLVLLVTIMSLAGPVAFAQPDFGGPFGRASPSILVGQKSVQKELKLSDEQIKKADDAAEKFRAKFRDALSLGGEERVKKIPEVLKENEKAVAEILKPEQAKRLKQIFYQWQGPQSSAAIRNWSKPCSSTTSRRKSFRT